jgi:predicted RNA-binding protein YlxR (DUF448 family)
MGKGKAHNPRRTCISCGTKRSKKELIRIVLDSENQLIRDDQGKEPGRGAYICRTGRCMEQLKKNQHLNRSFRTDESILIGPIFWKE